MTKTKNTQRFDDGSIRLFNMYFSDERIARLVNEEVRQRIAENPKVRDARSLVPIIDEKDLGNGVTEKKIIHHGWIEWYLVPEKIRSKLKIGRMFGKYQYLWKKGNEIVSCVEFDNKLLYPNFPWETCHPEMRYKTIGEARSYIKKYFKRKSKK